mgnify:CR=1 FL=1
MSPFFYAGAFVLALGILITVHELGHYSIARLCGVKVLRFSVGFGRPLLSRRFGPDRPGAAHDFDDGSAQGGPASAAQSLGKSSQLAAPRLRTAAEGNHPFENAQADCFGRVDGTID